MHSDDEEDRTVIRPPSARTQAPSPAVPRTHHATQQPDAGAASAEQTQLSPPPAFSMPAGSPPPSALPGSGQHALTLPAGTRLGEFEVTETIGEGGFGIVYLAWDHSLERKVALKEYMPSSIASRIGASEIKPRSARHQETFEAGLKSFINEAKLLAQFDHPSLLKVYRFWEANGTAYMVMPFLEGLTLRDTVRGFASPPDEAWILALLAPLFDALTMLHASQIYHRDIAPDNVLLMADTGRPLLLDFGAARRVIGDMTQALTAILKPGYAPVEQYAEVPGLKQGPWTDVYALAAVVHWMILGKTPSPSVGRMFDDAQVSVAEKAAGRYSLQFLGAIDRALAVLPDKRTQTIDDFRRDLTGGEPGSMAPNTGFSLPPPTSLKTPPAGDAYRPTVGPASRTQVDERTRLQTMPPTRVLTQPANPEPRSTAPAPGSKLPLAVGAVVAVAVVVAAAAFALWPRVSAPTAATAPPTATVAPQTTASQPAVVPAIVAPQTPPAATTAAASSPPETAARVDAPAVVVAPPVATTTPSVQTRTTPRVAAERRTTPRTDTPAEPRERPAADPPRAAEPKPCCSTSRRWPRGRSISAWARSRCRTME